MTKEIKTLNYDYGTYEGECIDDVANGKEHSHGTMVVCIVDHGLMAGITYPEHLI